MKTDDYIFTLLVNGKPVLTGQNPNLYQAYAKFVQFMSYDANWLEKALKNDNVHSGKIKRFD